MFSGIVQGTGTVEKCEQRGDVVTIEVSLPNGLSDGLQIGASVALDGVCLTAVAVEGEVARFDLIEETLEKSTLSDCPIGRTFNIERALKFGDEIGGHLVSGHVSGTAKISKVSAGEHGSSLTLSCSIALLRGIIHKGFIAIDGISLTVGDVDRESGTFDVHLIPETLRVTTIGSKNEGANVNVELDSVTMAAIEAKQ